MSVFDKPKKQLGNFEELDITVQCSTCYEQLDIVKYYRTQQLLVWECSSGHTSMIEGWSLF